MNLVDVNSRELTLLVIFSLFYSFVRGKARSNY